MIVQPHKGIFMLYSMLIAYGIINPDQDMNPIRIATKENFKGYSGIGMEKKHIHHGPYSQYILRNYGPDEFFPRSPAVTDAQYRAEIMRGDNIPHYLAHFHRNTNFEHFYAKILPEYREYCNRVHDILMSYDLEAMLDKVWEVDKRMNTIVIPNPLGDDGGGDIFEGTSYSILGSCGGPDGTIYIFCHEGSHDRIFGLMDSAYDEIREYKRLFEKVIRVDNYPYNVYDDWNICFEEHFIRAMQSGFFDTRQITGNRIEKLLEFEMNEKGMLFIHDFYEEILRYKTNPTGRTFRDVVTAILNRLEAKYGS